MLTEINSRHARLPRKVFINLESVIRVASFHDDDDKEFVRIWMHGENMETVTIEEWERIKPLLVGTPESSAPEPAAPILPSVSPADLAWVHRSLVTFAIQDCAALPEIVRGVDVKGIAEDLITSIRGTVPAPALPDDVIAAYRDYTLKGIRPSNHYDDSDWKKSREKLIASIGSHMPIEESESHE